MPRTKAPVKTKREQRGGPSKKPLLQQTKKESKRKKFDNQDDIHTIIIDTFRAAKRTKRFSFNYNAGAQSAQTRLMLGEDEVEGKTTNNMHAELVVLGNALQRSPPLLMIARGGNIEVQGEGRRLKSAEFETVNPKNQDMPMDHCGYCTYFLTLLNVPTGNATFQTSVMAGAQIKGSAVQRSPEATLPYPLPEPILKHPAIIAKALGFNDANDFVNEVSEGIQAYYAESGEEEKSKVSKSQASESQKSRRSTRLRDLSPMESIVSNIAYEDFEKWRLADGESLKGLGSKDPNEVAEERFNTLLENFFGNKKSGFLNSLWNPVINKLTEIMGQDEIKRKKMLS